MNNSFSIPAPIHVTITSTTLKKGKPDVRTFEAHLGIDDGKRIIIVDVDGNRYEIEDVAKMAPADFRRIEPYLL